MTFILPAMSCSLTLHAPISQNREHPSCAAGAQAHQLVERWQPWWYSPEACALRLTARGTRPVKPLAEADTPEEPGAQPPDGAAAVSPVPEPPSRPVRGGPTLRHIYAAPR